MAGRFARSSPTLAANPGSVRCRAVTEPLSELRVDRQELQQVGDEAPAEAGSGLVPVAHRLAVPHRLPNDPAIGGKEDAVAVGGHDAGRHVGRQPFRKLRALNIEAGLGVDRGRARVEVEAADEHGFAVEGHGLGMQGR